jgi:uncharacterized protein (TIGR04255 family)
VERLAPEGAPLEFLSGQPLYRCRKTPGQWPLYQIGPGVFTANIVPEYGGWAAFRQFLAEGLAHLMEAFPLPERLMKVSALELRYIDAFTKVHGIDDEVFIQRHLGFNISLPESLKTEILARDQMVALSAHFVCQTQRPEVGLNIKVGQGKSANQPAIILDLRTVSKGEIQSAEAAIIGWFDAAHSVLHDSFELITSQGPKIELVRTDDAPANRR